MASRSKRQPRPTAKYLEYHYEDLNKSKLKNEKSKNSSIVKVGSTENISESPIKKSVQKEITVERNLDQTTLKDTKMKKNEELVKEKKIKKEDIKIPEKTVKPQSSSEISILKRKNTSLMEESPPTKKIIINASPTKKSPIANDVIIKIESPETEARNLSLLLQNFHKLGSKLTSVMTDSLQKSECSFLSATSTFEKKCAKLIEAIADHGKDVDEQEMEKILRILDEEHEERCRYRRTLLESLRASHTANMALYVEMINVLKTI